MKFNFEDFDHQLYLDMRRNFIDIIFNKFTIKIQESEFLELEEINFGFIGEII